MSQSVGEAVRNKETTIVQIMHGLEIFKENCPHDDDMKTINAGEMGLDEKQLNMFLSCPFITHTVLVATRRGLIT